MKKWINNGDAVADLNGTSYLNDVDEMSRVASQFAIRSNGLFTGCIGALDGWLVRIQSLQAIDGVDSPVKDLILLCRKENGDNAEEDSLRLQSLLETHNEPVTNEWKVQSRLYRQFIEFCVLNVVGKTRMKKMGENYADRVRETYEDAIKPTNKGFAMLCLENRLRLWATIVEAEKRGNDGTKSLENKDEDDQREHGEDNKVEP